MANPNNIDDVLHQNTPNKLLEIAQCIIDEHFKGQLTDIESKIVLEMIELILKYKFARYPELIN